MSRILEAKCINSLRRIYKVLFFIAIFLAIFNYEWKLVIAFLITALVLLIVYLSCHLFKKSRLIQSGLYLSWADALRRGGVYTAKSFTQKETYILFDTSDSNILECKNVRSVTKDREHGLVITPIDAIARHSQLETIGVEPETVTVRTNRVILKFDTAPQGLVAVKITSD